MPYPARMRIQQIEPLAVSPTQAALLLSLSKRKVQDLMSRGVIPFRKVGRRTLIPFSALKSFLRIDHPTAQGNQHGQPDSQEARAGA